MQPTNLTQLQDSYNNKSYEQLLAEKLDIERDLTILNRNDIRSKRSEQQLTNLRTKIACINVSMSIRKKERKEELDKLIALGNNYIKETLLNYGIDDPELVEKMGRKLNARHDKIQADFPLMPPVTGVAWLVNLCQRISKVGS
jgi:hypothetical protein